MSYKVIVDSCGELTAEMKASGRFETASLGLEVGDCHIMPDMSKVKLSVSGDIYGRISL